MTTRRKYSSLFFWFGILFLLAGLFFYLTFWYFIYGLASFLLGALMILLSITNWKTKLLTVGFPLVFVGYSFYKSFAPPERYLIPENYRGPIMIIFKQQDGEPKEYEGKRRLYRIPPSGVLFTQFDGIEGWLDQDYYLVKPSGQRIKLGVLDTRDFNEESTVVKNPNEPSRDSVAIFNPGVAGRMGNSGDPDSKVFSQLWIRAYADTMQMDFKQEYIDSLQRATQKNHH